MRFRSPSPRMPAGTRPILWAKAQNLLSQAQQALDHKAGMTMVVTLARQAAQTAEDARVLAIQRKQDDELNQARNQAARAETQRAQAEAVAQTAQAQAAAAHVLLEQERVAKQAAQAQAQAAAAAAEAADRQAPPPPPQAQSAQDRDEPRKKELRRQLLEQFNASLSARDTPRGRAQGASGSDGGSGRQRELLIRARARRTRCLDRGWRACRRGHRARIGGQPAADLQCHRCRPRAEPPRRDRCLWQSDRRHALLGTEL